MTTPAQPKAVTSTAVVYEAVCELHRQAQIATRETVAQLTGLKLTIVDDRLGVLVDDEKLKRVLRGVYVPVTQHPPARSISKRVLADGCVEIEVGDEVLLLTPAEDRSLAMLQAGAATQAIAVQTGQQMAMMATELAARVKRLEQQNVALHQALAQKPGPQMELLPG